MARSELSFFMETFPMQLQLRENSIASVIPIFLFFSNLSDFWNSKNCYSNKNIAFIRNSINSAYYFNCLYFHKYELSRGISINIFFNSVFVTFQIIIDSFRKEGRWDDLRKQYKQYIKTLKQKKAFKSSYSTDEERLAYAESVFLSISNIFYEKQFWYSCIVES